MKKGLTELVFILDKSGSMGGLESDTIGGSTALLDALGRMINKIRNAQMHTADDYRAEKVMLIIITDGEENSSREYRLEKVKAQISTLCRQLHASVSHPTVLRTITLIARAWSSTSA